MPFGMPEEVGGVCVCVFVMQQPLLWI